jgi:alpha-L-fucosidase 2
MKFYKPILSLIILISLSGSGLAQSSTQFKLWYNKPAGKVWTDALPIGNGRLGAMVYGNPELECIKLNESTVWSGGPNRNDNPDALKALPQIRQLIFAGKQAEAQKLAERYIESKKAHGMMFQPVGNLYLDFPGHDQYSNYYRELNLENATTLTTYEVDGVKYSREVLATIPGQLIVMRLTADKPGKLSFKAYMNSPQKVKTAAMGNQLAMSGITSDHEGVKGQVKFQTYTRVLNEGGSIITDDTAVSVKNANAVTIFISIATNFVNYKNLSADEVKRSAEYLAKGANKSFATLKKDHVQAYQRFFNRVKIDLGSTEAVNKPTDMRLKEFANSNDPQFVALYFQFGRYLLISCSQPGGQPANLQGIWNDLMNPPWDSKYTININTEMNYWPAEKDNLSEMHEPLVQMVKELAETGKETARVMYGSRGWMAHHNTDIWRITGPVDPAFYGIWSMGGAWLSTHLWEKYEYSGDKKYLASVYPVLKGAATFFVDYLVEEPENKWLVINPGMSPENAPSVRPNISIDAGTTMDNQIVFDILSVTIRAADALKMDKAFADTLKAVRKRLPPMQIGKHGQLQEWMHDLDDPRDQHRHVSHLYGLHPSSQISAYRTPELFSAAHTTLLHRGDVSTGWSMGWKVNWWARFQDGNHAYKLIQDQLSPVGTHAGGGGTYNNLFDAHAPFQIDGNFGCTSGITEMLMQSHDGVLHLLPALPDQFKDGKISGIRAKGGFEIADMVWKDGKLVKVIIKSTLGGNCRLRLPHEMKGAGLKRAKGINNNPYYQTEETAEPIISPLATLKKLDLKPTLEYDLVTEPGKVYTLSL